MFELYLEKCQMGQEFRIVHHSAKLNYKLSYNFLPIICAY